MRGGFRGVRRAAKSSRLSAGLGVRISDAASIVSRLTTSRDPHVYFDAWQLCRGRTTRRRSFLDVSKLISQPREEIVAKRMETNSRNDRCKKLYDDLEPAL